MLPIGRENFASTPRKGPFPSTQSRLCLPHEIFTFSLAFFFPIGSFLLPPAATPSPEALPRSSIGSFFFSHSSPLFSLLFLQQFFPLLSPSRAVSDESRTRPSSRHLRQLSPLLLIRVSFSLSLKLSTSPETPHSSLLPARDRSPPSPANSPTAGEPHPSTLTAPFSPLLEPSPYSSSSRDIPRRTLQPSFSGELTGAGESPRRNPLFCSSRDLPSARDLPRDSSSQASTTQPSPSSYNPDSHLLYSGEPPTGGQ